MTRDVAHPLTLSGACAAWAKRGFDFVAAALVLLLLSPVLALAALAIAAKLGRPILFTQMRPGLDGKPFKLVKFRTMLDHVDSYGKPLSDAERLTPFGRFLRSTSVDELPELWNVLKGEMSLVGPRPLLLHYLDLYTPFQMRRHEVRPGITGWAQVNGRNALCWAERFALDVWYVDNRSFLLDLKILWRTISQVVARRGISAEGEATMPYFTGEGESAAAPADPTPLGYQAKGGRSGIDI